MGRRTQLTDELLRHDVDISWWVTLGCTRLAGGVLVATWFIAFVENGDDMLAFTRQRSAYGSYVPKLHKWPSQSRTEYSREP